MEAQRRGRSSGDELILSWAQDHKPETLSNGPGGIVLSVSLG